MEEKKRKVENKILVYMDKDTRALLETLAKQTGKSMSAVIKTLIIREYNEIVRKKP